MEPVLLVPIAAIVGAFAFLIVHTVMRARVRELEIRQRIAMIERGLVPPPEVDPKGFDRAMTRLEAPRVSRAAARHRRAGLMAIGVGVGLMLLIGVAFGSPEAGIGVGGFLVVVGLAFLANSWFELRQRAQEPLVSTPAEPTRHD